MIDDGVQVEGYAADITRTVVFGKATARQTEVWNKELEAQTAAFKAIKIGAPCESVDAAARKVITDAGFGPGYKVPGLPHRTGHGIGLDGHEWTNFVKGNTTPIAAGMCFSDEPTIAIPGEFGIRLEDCVYVVRRRPALFLEAERRDRQAVRGLNARAGSREARKMGKRGPRLLGGSRKFRQVGNEDPRHIVACRRNTICLPSGVHSDPHHYPASASADASLRSRASRMPM